MQTNITKNSAGNILRARLS